MTKEQILEELYDIATVVGDGEAEELTVKLALKIEENGLIDERERTD